MSNDADQKPKVWRWELIENMLSSPTILQTRCHITEEYANEWEPES